MTSTPLKQLAIRLILTLATIAVGGATTPAHAQSEPAIGIEWQTWQMGTVQPGSSFSRVINIGMFFLGANVTASTTSGTTSITPAQQFIAANQSEQFIISGTAPIAPGPFTITVNFTYSNSSGPVATPVWLSGSVSSGTGSTTYFVGVIPQTVSNPPNAATDCPPGASLVYFHLDNEDSDNENNRSGWIGSIRSDQNTRFHYCRVDGRMFKPLSTTDSASNHYAVAKLGTNCPPGSASFERYWDNENSDNRNSLWTSSGRSLDFGPNHEFGNDLSLHFCLFRSGTDTMSTFPNLGIHYGVFAAPGFSRAVQSGHVFTDDEDTTNDNRMTANEAAKEIIVPTGSEGRNTTVYVARVTPETRPVASCTRSPGSGTDYVYATFNDNGSYARGGRVLTSYSWSFSGGSTASGPGPHTRGFNTGTHYGRLTVTDNAGESATAYCYVYVASNNCESAAAGGAGLQEIPDRCPLD